MDADTNACNREVAAFNLQYPINIGNLKDRFFAGRCTAEVEKPPPGAGCGPGT